MMTAAEHLEELSYKTKLILKIVIVTFHSLVSLLLNLRFPPSHHLFFMNAFLEIYCSLQ